ncbi:MAG: hypothetical protein J6L89_08320 [Clostridia bacterium]|nr:hypothetical protein [Clostridia bacterium]
MKKIKIISLAIFLLCFVMLTAGCESYEEEGTEAVTESSYNYGSSNDADSDDDDYDYNYDSGSDYNYDSDYDSDYSYDSYDYDSDVYEYDADDFGYGDPQPGDSFSDYIKREDPDLYNNILENYESLY